MAFPKSLIDVLFFYFYFAPRNLAFPFSHRKEASTTKVNGMFFFLLHDFGFPKSLKTYVGRKEKKNFKNLRVIFIRLLHNFILFVKEMKISYHLPTKSTSILLWTCIVQVYFDISMISKVSSLLEIFFEIFWEYALTSKFPKRGSSLSKVFGT